MKSKYKKTTIVIVTIIFVILFLSLLVNFFIERKIGTFINTKLDSTKIEYTSIDVNVWTGNLVFTSPTVFLVGQTTNKTILNAKLKSIEINDIGYWDLLFNDQITVESVVVNQLVAKYVHNTIVKKDHYKSGFLDKIEQVIKIKALKINNADVLITDYVTDSIVLSIPKFNFDLKDFQINPKASITNKKFKYSDFNLIAQNLKWSINEFEDLLAESIDITNNSATFKDFKLKTKYSKDQYSKILKTERDHFKLDIKEVKISDMDFGFNSEGKFYFKSNHVRFNLPKAQIYRDKLVADDLSYKPLYGAMLRDLKFELNLKLIEISQGKISYLEKVKLDKPAGRLDFIDIDATITNLGNTNANTDTSIKVNSTFMENSPLEVNWNFKVADTTDQFVFKGDLGWFKAAQMDQFTQPNLNVDLNGELKQTYFTISGNPRISRIDLKIKYDDFEISILKKGEIEKNKLLSTIVNLFVSEDSEEEKRNFRYGQADTIERDTTKSVFNFIWLNLKGGLRSSLIGDGKKVN
ncbi:hypothetical protein [Winogradskyella sp. Asnod2-B02-A]|uniref:hypothetical protein n=1 Tax=Winogradskyella sp. Asnod2-B02-A TaxID=3160583 RepID=UPI0038673871